MAEEKKHKLKTKVKTTGKIPADLEISLKAMANLSVDKPVTGEMDYLIKKKDGEIVIDEYSMSETLGDAYQALGKKIQESAQHDLAGVTDGKIRVLFESEAESIIG